MSPSLRDIPRPGRRAGWVARRAGVAAGTAGGLGVLGWGVIVAEARLARRSIGEPTEHAPDPSGSYGNPRRGRKPLHLAVLGDSSAAGLGCEDAAQTPGALLAGLLAHYLDRRVLLDVQATTGARAKDLDLQVQRAQRHDVDVAVIMVGANDVTHRTPPPTAARALVRASSTLQASGTRVVVGTCPDLGSVAPLLQPLRRLARIRSRQMAEAQTIAVVEQGAIAISMGDLLGPEFAREPHLWGPDRFHPSPAGYLRVVEALLPGALQAAGMDMPSELVSDSVQDVDVAAAVAAVNPGLEVEAVEGTDGAASAGPGRLARLRRRLPLVGGGTPAGPTGEQDLSEEELTDEG